MSDLSKFRELGVSDSIIEALKKKGFEEPSPVQEKVIPLLLEKERDIVAQAQTGTGKTAAFGIPLVERIDGSGKNTSALILTPTRELAIQVAEEINSLKGNKAIRVTPLYGGQDIVQQLQALKRGIHIVVGTPGRILDHIKRRSLDLSTLSYLVLDEADEMLNMGFIEDVEDIIAAAGEERNVLLFSATIPNRIMELAQRYMEDCVTVRIKQEQPVTDLTEQIYFEVRESDKFEALCRIIDVEKEFYSMIFCRTKVDVDNVTNKLLDRGYNAEALHGDLSQYVRERIIDKFKSRRVNILVATDVAARGIDIVRLTHVINYSLPQNPESYVHRIGRTGRAGASGTAVTFVTPAESRMLQFIKRKAKTEITRKNIPGVEEIIDTKKEHILSDIQNVLATGGFEKFMPMAKELLTGNDILEVLAAMIKYSFADLLDEKNYSQIKNISSVDESGKTRLFIAKGRRDGMSKRSLVEYITRKSGVRGKKIDDVEILEEFSFITVPFIEAEVIIGKFKKSGHGKKPMVIKAKKKERPEVKTIKKKRKYS